MDETDGVVIQYRKGLGEWYAATLVLRATEAPLVERMREAHEGATGMTGAEAAEEMRVLEVMRGEVERVRAREQEAWGRLKTEVGGVGAAGDAWGRILPAD
jgi:hypothetical protein